VLFIAVAVPWIDKPGIQTDEVLFAGGIYPPFDEGSIVWPPSPASVRVPSVLLGRCRSGGGTC
jgi:hypothetical protein